MKNLSSNKISLCISEKQLIWLVFFMCEYIDQVSILQEIRGYSSRGYIL